MRGGDELAIAFHLDIELKHLTSWLNRMTQPVLIVHEDGSVEEANQQLMEMIQYSRQEIVGQMYSQFLHLSRETLASDPLDNREPGCWTIEGELISQSGYRYLCTIQVLSGRDGDRWVHLLSIYPHKTREDHFLAQVSNDMFNSLPLGLLLVDNDGRVMGINNMACQLFNVEKEEIIYQPIGLLFSNDQLGHWELFETLLHAGGVQTLVSPLGEKKSELSISSGYLCDQKGQVAGRYFALRDITHLRSLEESIEENDRLATIGQIAAGTAHEIRNPLTSIRGFLQVMEHTLKEKERSKEYGYTEIMLREIDRINSLVSEFLSLSKPRSKKMVPIQVKDVFSEILPIIKGEAILHNIEVEYEMGVTLLPYIMADEKILKQIFLNICKNAIEAMRDGGNLKIKVRSDSENQTLIVDICDEGPGIPPTVIAQIFDPFFTTKESGTGLGLAVCQRLVQEIGGSIRVMSDSLGTTFTIYLPIKSDICG